MALSKLTRVKAIGATFTATVVGAITRTLHSKVSDVLSPKDFGAVGDNVTNDWAAVQAAVNYASSSGKSLVFDAMYRVADAIQIPVEGCTLVSHSRVFGLSTVSTPNVSGGGQRLIHAEGASNFTIDGLFLDLADLPVDGGVRAIYVRDSHNYVIKNCRSHTPGAFVASLNCYDYAVHHNHMEIHSTDGEPRHDGIIDQWFGSHDFSIHHNVVDGRGIGKYGILCTGTDSLNQPTPSYNFDMSYNIVRGTRLLGMQVHGRNGGIYNFDIGHNLIEDITLFHGLGVLDAWDGSVTYNTIKSVAKIGIHIEKEGGDVPGLFAVKHVTFIGNTVTDTNEDNTTGSDSIAIVINDECTGLVFENNHVSGTQHTIGMRFAGATLGNHIGRNTLEGATEDNFVDNSSSNLTVSGIYAPVAGTLVNVAAINISSARYSITGDLVTVTGKVRVTPTATTSTSFIVTLPKPSNFTNSDVDGSGHITSSFSGAGIASPQTATNDMKLSFDADNTAQNTMNYSFTYVIR